ncbi:TPA: group I intron-associated PD-(D/E)XK endonuclease [Vibrio diabolicus]
MKTAVIGKAKELEVASALVSKNLYVYFPLVDNGYDLIVSDDDGKRHMPVQVKYRKKDSSINFNMKDVERFKGKNVIIAWLTGEGCNYKSWYLPFDLWLEHAKDTKRADNFLNLTISQTNWLADYEGAKGIEEICNLLKHT